MTLISVISAQTRVCVFFLKFIRFRIKTERLRFMDSNEKKWHFTRKSDQHKICTSSSKEEKKNKNK